MQMNPCLATDVLTIPAWQPTCWPFPLGATNRMDTIVECCVGKACHWPV